MKWIRICGTQRQLPRSSPRLGKKLKSSSVRYNFKTKPIYNSKRPTWASNLRSKQCTITVGLVARICGSHPEPRFDSQTRKDFEVKQCLLFFRKRFQCNRTSDQQADKKWGLRSEHFQLDWRLSPTWPGFRTRTGKYFEEKQCLLINWISICGPQHQIQGSPPWLGKTLKSSSVCYYSKSIPMHNSKRPTWASNKSKQSTITIGLVARICGPHPQAAGSTPRLGKKLG